MKHPPNRALWSWVAIGLLAYLVLPWYAVQEASGLTRVLRVFSDEASGNGLWQALQGGRPWLLAGLAALLVTAFAASMVPGRRQGVVLAAGGGLGALALLL